jgi:hypothetical protein
LLFETLWGLISWHFFHMGLLLLFIAKRQLILQTRVLQDPCLLIHLLSRANNRCCISHTTSTGNEKFIVLESLEWVRSPTSLQVLGFYIPYHAPLDYLIFCKDGVSPNFLFEFNLLKPHMVL